MEEAKTTKRTPEAIRMYNDISEDFHVIDVIVDKLSVLREISSTYGNDITLKEAIETLEDQHSRITNGIFTKLVKKRVNERD